MPYVDVVCTSGPGTGMEASPQKLAGMRGGIGPSAALALASGVTADNVVRYLLHVDAFLVGTGLEASFGVLDPGKLQRLQAEIAAYDPATAAARARAAADPVAATIQRLEAIRWGTAPKWERRARELLFDFYRRLLPVWPQDAHKILPADPKVIAALRARLSPTDVTRVDANAKRLGDGRSPTVRSLIELILTGAVLRARGQLDETTEPGVPLLDLFEAGYDLNPTHSGVDVMYASGMTTVPLPTRAQLGAPASSSPELAAAEPDASLLTQIAQLRDVPVPVLVQALATATATAEGLEGVALRQQITDLAGQIQTVLRSFRIQAAALRQRSKTSAEADRLLDAIARTDTAAGRVIAAHRADIAALLAELDLSQLSSSLQLLVAWLSDPANANPASMQQLLARLQAATAAPAGRGDKTP